METLPDFDIELYEDLDGFIDQLIYGLQLLSTDGDRFNEPDCVEIGCKSIGISISLLRRVCWRLKNE